MSALPTQVGALAQRSIMRTARQPASAIPPLIFPVALMLAQLGRPQRLDRAAGVPDRLVPRLRARRAVHPGRAVLDDERRHRSRPRHPDRLLLPALADARARRRRCSPASSPGIVVLGVLQAVFYIACGLLLGVHFAAGAAGIALLLVYAALVAVGFGALGVVPRAAHRLGRGDPGALPAALRLPLHLVDEHAAQPDRRRLVPVPRLDQPGLVPDRVRPQPDHHGLGRRGARARVRHRDRARDRRASSSRSREMGRRLDRA